MNTNTNAMVTIGNGSKLHFAIGGTMVACSAVRRQIWQGMAVAVSLEGASDSAEYAGILMAEGVSADTVCQSCAGVVANIMREAEAN